MHAVREVTTTRDAAGRMHPLSLRFTAPALEASFAEEQARKARRF